MLLLIVNFRRKMFFLKLVRIVALLISKIHFGGPMV